MPGTDAGSRLYDDVTEFVENYLSLVYRRDVSEGSGYVWCPQWWKPGWDVQILLRIGRPFESAGASPAPVARARYACGTVGVTQHVQHTAG
ncbi:DUF4913 domain-containing protein [Nocardia jejuensis]|uniref:DUF4913 domain-containing protein n=1 Tax=Nocardia jejuensis TaxID=328049 RepID=UPI001FE0BDF9|nr:DUF4913 domain-containing protein [Nocardia jejuensis]